MGDGSGSLVPGEPFPKRHAGTVGRWSGPDGIPTLARVGMRTLGSILESGDELEEELVALEIILDAGFVVPGTDKAHSLMSANG